MTTQTHFAIPDAREMLFETPLCCPWFGAITFDGLAASPDDNIHLIIRCGPTRVYLGPTAQMAARRTTIMLRALTNSGQIDDDRAVGISAWLGECWTETTEEITEAVALAAVPSVGESLRSERAIPSETNGRTTRKAS